MVDTSGLERFKTTPQLFGEPNCYTYAHGRVDRIRYAERIINYILFYFAVRCDKIKFTPLLVC